MEDSVIVRGPCLIEQQPGFDKAGFELVRNSILKHLLAYGAMSTEELGSLVENHLRNKFAGSLVVHYEVVRQELEERGEVRRIPGQHPPLIELAE